MAQVLVKDAPGGHEAYQCPYCGHLYLTKVVDEAGQITNQDADAPRNCRRCGSPMDIDAAQKFRGRRLT